MTNPKGRQPKSIARQYAESIGLALILAIVLRSSFVQAYVIPSGSMEPTILVGDHIFVNKIAYGLRIPDSIAGLPVPGLSSGMYLLHLAPIHRGDIIVFVSPRDRGVDLIKRVIGVPGDRVQVINGIVWRNGAQIPDPHAYFAPRETARSPFSPTDNFPPRNPLYPDIDPGPVVVPPGKLFAMGDNRDDSLDSRFWGFADQNDVEGRALAVYFSWDHDGTGMLPVRWNRFGKVLD
ncbi:MAG TPA: signal peptidase I [Candidatus Binataceae bacterium]|nr:signal peptidase I [Candidatus Binataceae bacterium]